MCWNSLAVEIDAAARLHDHVAFVYSSGRSIHRLFKAPHHRVLTFSTVAPTAVPGLEAPSQSDVPFHAVALA
jgi:hypothetical protein